MTVVSECIGQPHQIPVTATLWGGTKAVVGHHIPTDVLVTTVSTATTGASGCWSMNLLPNSEIEPAGTTWRIMRDDLCGGRDDYITFISVPASGGPFDAWDLQVAVPGSIPSSELSVHSSGPSHLTSAVQAPAGGWGPIPFNLASSRLVRGLVLGDSVPLGQFSSNWLSKGFISLFRNRGQALWGDGGTGYQNHVYTTAEVGAGGVTTSGAWITADNLGVTRQSFKPAVAGNGAIITYTIRGTSVDMWFKTSTAPAYGTFHYSIDGGAFQAVNLNVAASILKVTVNGLAASGTHTVAIRATTGDGESLGVSGRYATGLLIQNASVGGTLLTQAGGDVPGTSNTDSYLDTMAYHTATQLGPLDFAIIHLGINDILLDTAAASFVEDTYNALSSIRVGLEAASFVNGIAPPTIICAGHVGKADVLAGFSQFERDWVEMHTMLRDAAASMGALLIDYWALGKRSWQDWANKGYWYFDGASFNDVHPGDTGHAYMADVLWNAATLAVV